MLITRGTQCPGRGRISPPARWYQTFFVEEKSLFVPLFFYKDRNWTIFCTSICTLCKCLCKKSKEDHPAVGDSPVHLVKRPVCMATAYLVLFTRGTRSLTWQRMSPPAGRKISCLFRNHSHNVQMVSEQDRLRPMLPQAQPAFGSGIGPEQTVPRNACNSKTV